MKRKLRIVWTNKGKSSFKKAYEYYAEYSVNSSKALKNRIFKKLSLLLSYPEMGPILDFPISRKKQYRYLIERQYKIIYWLEGSDIVIADIFDTRQDPMNLQKLD